MKTSITIGTTVNVPVEKVWDCWNTPEHIYQWNNASPYWHTLAAKNDLRIGGRFSFTMAAKDGSFSFDFGGTYTEVILHQRISYTMNDGRTAEVLFQANGNLTVISEMFEPESINPAEMQQAGWQAILDNFKRYTESI
jgi:uncharacterized protein YndB with AHSA1/START domain